MNTSFYVSLDKNALYHNIEYLREYKQKELLPVIKANAYGHNYLLIAKALYDFNIKTWATARFSEAITITEYMINNFSINDFKILVFESLDDDYSFLEKYPQICPTINSIKDLKNALANNIPIDRLSLKIDFGFGRNGIKAEEVDELKNLIKFNSLKFLGIFSHLFSATYTDGLEVIRKFTGVVNKLGKDNFEMIHLQNAAGIYNYNVEVVTHIRTGMLTYGLQEAGFYDHDLKPVFTGLIGYVVSVRYVNELDYVAYEDLSSINPKTKKIAKIKIGYGDGFLKANNKTTCLIKKKEYVISQVTMDNTFIEVDDRVNVGDKVHLYHRPNEMKTRTGLSMLEALIALSPLRVKRIFEGEEN
ncbi:alanine racemase [Fusobacterium vincentii]|uniref:alanine racemase n=1 Tax=Fusobacterium vincentii TaxID=155615 RepID=UPI0001D0A4A9|nr:alanine racemase [Fusobacterium vincentii]EFG34937.1 alanine racemase [Fusobacterium vincentii 3_1_27]BEO94427.1 alanine racemase [Fusobacterium nucleatum]BEP05123.1 alanine racemase [Fusobacterium nucleatum]